MKTECPHCGQHYEVDQEYADQIVECTSCGQEFVVEIQPEQGSVIAPPPPEAPPVQEQAVYTQAQPQAANYYNSATIEQQNTNSGLKALACEMCGSTDMIKQNGVFVCQSCGTKYSLEEAKRMMIAGTVNVAGTVTVDNSAFIQKSLDNARRALGKDDWEEVEKYYNIVERESPKCIEAVFFSSFGKAMYSLTDQEYFKRQQKFDVLIKSISVINDYYEETTENKEAVLRKICDAVAHMYSVEFVYDANNWGGGGSKSWTEKLLGAVKDAVIIELKQIQKVHKDEKYLQELINQLSNIRSGGCYIATAVYGSYDCPEVWTLRRFRDLNLGASWYGRLFIKLYYLVSPTIVKCFGKTKIFQTFWRKKLDRFVKKLNNRGVSSSPYVDKKWYL